MGCSPWGHRELGTTERLSTPRDHLMDIRLVSTFDYYGYCCYEQVFAYTYIFFWGGHVFRGRIHESKTVNSMVEIF